MTSDINIGGLIVGDSADPFIIAEMSGNHNGSLDRSLEIVDAIAASGAHALKLQTYTADTMTISSDTDEFYISDSASPWVGNTLYDLYQKAHTPWEWHKPIFEHAKKAGLIAFSTPFDATAVDFLETLDVPAYKIASFEICDHELVAKVAQQKKPMIISTGMASIDEVHLSVECARDNGAEQIILLKCTSNYPADASDSNIKALPLLRDIFSCQVGLSDHTLGIGAALCAVSHGASVIEKHVTLKRADGGVDSAFSLEPRELRQLVEESKIAKESLGSARLGPTDAEGASRIFRRSLYICADLEAGDVLTSKNLRSIRPGHGLPPSMLRQFLGKKVNKRTLRGTPLSFDLIG